jgi:AraC-like DNA-binding protein
VYRIELQPTAPFEHWSSPAREIVVERLPHWFTAWWMWCVYALFIVFLVSLIVYNYVLRRQRHRFLEQMCALDKPATVESSLADPDSSVEEKAPARESAQESALLKKAIAQVEKNLSNEQYTVEDLSRDLCMSRMTFYRKIQSLTGQKPTEFIRTIRLRYAAKLLREGKLTVTEVSYATGFSSVSYFSRCFRTMFGMSPTQFAGKSDLAEPESLITMG